MRFFFYFWLILTIPAITFAQSGFITEGDWVKDKLAELVPVEIICRKRSIRKRLDFGFRFLLLSKLVALPGNPRFSCPNVANQGFVMNQVSNQQSN